MYDIPSRLFSRIREEGDRGAVIVETAIILPLLFLLMGGALHFGVALRLQHQLLGITKSSVRTVAAFRPVLGKEKDFCLVSTDCTKSSSSASCMAAQQTQSLLKAGLGEEEEWEISATTAPGESVGGLAPLLLSVRIARKETAPCSFCFLTKKPLIWLRTELSLSLEGCRT
jgi:Flp pilus assembly protein TadG